MTRARSARRPSDDPSVQTAETAWQTLFNSPPPRAGWLIEQAVAWQQQVERHGDVTRAVREDLRIAAQQARDARARIRPDASPRRTIVPSKPAIPSADKASCPPALPPASSALLPGARLVKQHGGRTHVVEVLDNGFLYEGATFGSLSAIAKAITGTHWNGLLFFGLRKRKVYPAKAG